MAYKQCPWCKTVTDENESQCPSCANHLGDKIITAKELISSIESGEILLSKIWTKHPNELYPIPKSLP